MVGRQVPEMLSLLRHLVLTIVVVFSAAITTSGPARTVPTLGLTADLVASTGAPVLRAPPAPEPTAWEDDSADRPSVDMRAVESDVDDANTACDVADDPAALEMSHPRTASGCLRPEASIAPAARHVTGPGLPRGPPV